MKKRVHEIAKEQGLSSKELLEKLKAAGIEAKAAASSVDESAVLKVLGSANGASAPAPDARPAPVAQAPEPAATAVAEPPAAAPTEDPPAAAPAVGEGSTADAAKAEAERVRPTRDSRTGERAPAAAAAAAAPTTRRSPRSTPRRRRPRT